jgi:small subunit ribosomal protein S1
MNEEVRAEGAGAGSAPTKSEQEKDSAPPKTPPDPRVQRLRDAARSAESISGKVIGWNNGGFHVVVDGLTAFCPRSEMELRQPRSPKSYLDQDYLFQVLRVRSRGRQIVLSRARHLRRERTQQRDAALGRLEAGAHITGKVVSLTDFGAFVDLGGVQGLVHRSEISRRPVDDPAAVLEVGQEVDVAILKIERGGQRISLSMRALEPDPWRDAAKKYPVGTSIEGRVERTESFGAFIELEPGLTGLLPSAAMGLPAETIPARAFPPGKLVRVQVQSVDPRRHRIALIREGAQMGGTEADYRDYKKKQSDDSRGGFNSLAGALAELQVKED